VHYVEGRTDREIGGVLGCSEAAAAKRRGRLLARLRSRRMPDE
jgi:DNA-directed RNA polymerase specialized sigma24 family protein